MKIKRLFVENIKRVRQAEVVPGDAHLIVIGGQNGEGKSSLLDGIPYAMAGKRAWPERPLRDGAERGTVVVDCGELCTTRTFTPGGGGTLTVEDADHKTFRSPQAKLDSLVNVFNFDPLVFLRSKAAAQAEELRRLVGINLSEFDQQIADLKTERKAALGLRNEKQAEVDRVVVPEGTPDVPIDLGPLARQIAAADAHNRAVDAAHARARKLEQDGKAAADEVVRLQGEIAHLMVLLETAKNAVDKARKEHQEAATEAEHMQRISAEALLQQHAEAQAVNDHVRARQLRELLLAKVDEANGRIKSVDAQIATVTAARQQRLAAATFPVAGLGLDGNTVTFNGKPFEQASSAEQLRVSLAMGLAMNPDLRALIIRDGSLLDDKNMVLVEQMAREADAQVFMERVGTGPECTVIMADGVITGADAPAPEEDVS